MKKTKLFGSRLIDKIKIPRTPNVVMLGKNDNINEIKLEEGDLLDANSIVKAISNVTPDIDIKIDEVTDEQIDEIIKNLGDFIINQPIASTTVAGVVKIGNGINITKDGTISIESLQLEKSNYSYINYVECYATNDVAIIGVASQDKKSEEAVSVSMITSKEEEELVARLECVCTNGKGITITPTGIRSSDKELSSLSKCFATDGSIQEFAAKSELDALKLLLVATSEATVAMDANKAYDITVGDTLTLTLNAPADTSIVNEWQGSFTTGAAAPTVTWPANVIWSETPSVEVNTHYEFNIRLSNGKYFGLVQSWEIKEG